MNTILKLPAFVLVFVVFNQCERDESDTESIKDKNFLQLLIQKGIDVSHNVSLICFICGGYQLTGIDISRNTLLEHLNIQNMPSLKKVCTWISPFPPSGVYVASSGSPNVYYSTYCSK